MGVCVRERAFRREKEKELKIERERANGSHVYSLL